MIFVANRKIPLPKHENISQVIASQEEGSADRYILSKASNDELVITQDIPLAQQLVEKGLTALNNRGLIYNEENVRERKSMRDFMYTLRQSGLRIPETEPITEREVREFSNALDREITRRKKSG